MQQRATAAIPRLVLSTAGRMLREVSVDRPRLSIGRRAYNDLMLDDLTVSGEHAVLHRVRGETVIQDLNSRNGTLVDGVPVTRRALVDGDHIEIGVYTLLFRVDPSTGAGHGVPESIVARLVRLSGSGAGEVQPIDRPIVSVGSGTGQVAVIARRRTGYVITHLEGPTCPLVNGESIGLVSHPLNPMDLVELGGTIYQFHVEPYP
jgi:pSer/pThr/pTyr-binding forkhead associated (FHA) protein